GRADRDVPGRRAGPGGRAAVGPGPGRRGRGPARRPHREVERRHVRRDRPGGSEPGARGDGEDRRPAGRERGDVASRGRAAPSDRGAAGDPGGAAGVKEQGSVLVVDDDPVTRLMLTGALERRGLQVTTAEDGARALEAVGAGRFDVVLCDVMMPEVDGYQVLERLKSDPDLRHIPVVM